MGKKRNVRIGLRLDFPKTQTLETSKQSSTVVANQPKTAASTSAANVESSCTDSEFETILDKRLTKACDLESLTAFVEEWESVYALKMKYREGNLAPSYEEFEKLKDSKKLDSTLKKCTGFVKKLRNFTESQRDSIEKDLQTLNLTKYVGEIAAAIAETRFKISDVNEILHICSEIHRRYSDFSSLLLENMKRVLPSKKVDASTLSLKTTGRDLRLTGDLITVGILPPAESFTVLLITVRTIIASDKDGVQSLIPILSFCKGVGDEMVGILPSNILNLCEENSVKISRYDVIPAERRVLMKNLLHDYFTFMCGILTKLHDEVLKSEVHNRKLMRNRGEIPDDRQAAHSECVAKFESFNVNATKLALLLNENLPTLRSLPPPAPDEVEDRSLSPSANEMNGIVPGIVIFEDEDTRAFYQDLPDLKVYLPPVAYRDNLLQAAEEAKKIEEREKLVANVDAESVQAELNEEKIEVDEESTVDTEDLPSNLLDTEEEKREDALLKPSFQIFLTNLLNCVTREMIDKAAMEFAENYNNRPNRAKLIRTLFHIPRQRIDLLPLWSRLIAILSPVMPDIGMNTCSLLKNDFRYLVKKKNQIFIETKLKITRYIAELVNFKIFPKSDAFQVLKTLLMDFVHHQIEMACVFIETCGRFLHRSPESRRRMTIYLDEMMRKKTVKALEPRYVAMIDHAYYFVCPREGAQYSVKKLETGAAYLKNLILYDLRKSNLESTISLMKRFNWKNNKLRMIVLEALCQPWEVNNDQIRLLASLACGIAEICPEIGTALTDTVVELTYFGIEKPDTSENFRRIALIQYLGELYNYRMIASVSIFSVLYLLISYSTFSVNPMHFENLDPPHNLNRIRLVCTLLKTCGDYLNHGSNKKKLSTYLTYLQRYYWFKKQSPYWSAQNPFPFATEELVEDLIKWFKPRTKPMKSYEDACEEVEKLEKKMKKFNPEILENIGDDTLGGTESLSDGYVDNLNSDKAGDTKDWINYGATNRPKTNISADVDPLELEYDLIDDQMEDSSSQSKVPVKTESEYEQDEAFNRMCDKMLAQVNYDAKRINADIHIPLSIRSSSSSAPAIPEENSEGDKTVNFVLITRKGNKQTFKNLQLPVESEIVQKIKQREEAERLEKERVKALTLGISMMQEAEEEKELQAKLQATQQNHGPQYGWKITKS